MMCTGLEGQSLPAVPEPAFCAASRNGGEEETPNTTSAARKRDDAGMEACFSPLQSADCRGSHYNCHDSAAGCISPLPWAHVKEFASNTSQSGKPPLTGVRVVDFTRVIAGPLASQILSDMGAEVIKIGNPDGGDDTRKGAGPRAGGRSGESHFFMTYNRGKKSVALDFTAPRKARASRAQAARRMPTCLLREDFRPGVLKQLRPRLSEPRGEAFYPRLIYLLDQCLRPDGPAE